VTMQGAKYPISGRVYGGIYPTPPPLIVFFHAGGLSMGGLDTHDSACRLLAHEARCKVLAVDYALAPEVKFPVAVEQAYEAVIWAFNNSQQLEIDVDKVCVAGDSSGGTLATVACRLFRDRAAQGLNPAVFSCSNRSSAKHTAPRIKLQFLWYPTVGNAPGPAPLREELASGYILDSKLQQWLQSNYLSATDDPQDERVSPIKAVDFYGMPPITIVSAGYDPCQEAHQAYCKMHAGAGVPASFYIAPTTLHGFLMFVGSAKSAKSAVLESAMLIRSKLTK